MKQPTRARAKKANKVKKTVDAAKLQERLNHPCGLLSKPEVLAITNVSYPTLWDWMRHCKFPRSRIVGGKSQWFAVEVVQWMQELPLRPLKGDRAEVEA
jgi:predicted DNA-binding transcriptional regulator AlpA